MKYAHEGGWHRRLEKCGSPHGPPSPTTPPTITTITVIV